MRYLAIDLGDKRTGVAVGDDETRIVTPRPVIEVPIAENGGDALVAAVVRAIDAEFTPYAKATIVIGLPLNMDDSEGPQAKKARAFGDRIAAATKRPVAYQDERLTSVEADWTMAQSGLTHQQKKQRRDSLAAGAILRDFLERTRSGDAGAEAGPTTGW